MEGVHGTPYNSAIRNQQSAILGYSHSMVAGGLLEMS
jgi:hypothetical protein